MNSRRNHNGYHGERIDIAEVLGRLRTSALRAGWRFEVLPVAHGLELLSLHRPGLPGAPRLYLSAGIHGDEPAGPLAALELIRDGTWGRGLDLTLCPCLNPSGFPLNRRENHAGYDLNRDYLHLQTPEVSAHVGWLARQPRFDITVCLHEDWEAHGFYLYELNPDGGRSFAQGVVDDVARVCPIDGSSLIDGRPAAGGIIRPDLDPALRPAWPEAFYLLKHKTRLSYTFEAPSELELAVRVGALAVGVRSVARRLAQVL